MAIKRFGDYEKTQAYGDYEALPKGGYVVKILGAELCSNSVGQYVKSAAISQKANMRASMQKNIKLSRVRIKNGTAIIF